MLPLPTSLLLSFLFIGSFLLLLLLGSLDTIALLHFAETQGVGHERLIGSSLLLFDSEKRVLADLGCNVTR
jgi:hypothetical protein